MAILQADVTSNTVILSKAQQILNGETSFTLSNTSGRDLSVTVQLLADKPKALEWVSFSQDSSAGGQPVTRLNETFRIGETRQYSVKISVPGSAEPGSYAIRVRAAEDSLPDENWVESPSVVFQVDQGQPPKKGFPWWIIAVVLAVLLVVGGVVAFLLLRPDAGDGTPTPTATSALTPTPTSEGPTLTPAVTVTFTPVPAPVNFAATYVSSWNCSPFQYTTFKVDNTGPVAFESYSFYLEGPPGTYVNAAMSNTPFKPAATQPDGDCVQAGVETLAPGSSAYVYIPMGVAGPPAGTNGLARLKFCAANDQGGECWETSVSFTYSY